MSDFVQGIIFGMVIGGALAVAGFALLHHLAEQDAFRRFWL